VCPANEAEEELQPQEGELRSTLFAWQAQLELTKIIFVSAKAPRNKLLNQFTAARPIGPISSLVSTYPEA